MRHGARIMLVAGLALAAGVGGCARPRVGFDSPEPAQRLYAIEDAAERNDRDAVPHLIELLDSDDPLVRMLSIRLLERFTGTTRGYDYAAPEFERRPAADDWARWYREEVIDQPAPASPASGSAPQEPTAP